MMTDFLLVYSNIIPSISNTVVIKVLAIEQQLSFSYIASPESLFKVRYSFMRKVFNKTFFY